MGLEREGGREEGPSVILPLACRTPLTLSVSRYRSLSRPERSRLWRIGRPLCAIFMACVRSLSLSLSLSLATCTSLSRSLRVRVQHIREEVMQSYEVGVAGRGRCRDQRFIRSLASYLCTARH